MVSIFKKDSLQVDENYLNHILQFVQFAAKLLDIQDDFKIYLLGKGDDGDSTTGGYSKQTNVITALYQDRALIDILRTIAHEIEHQRQNTFTIIGAKAQTTG